MNIEEQKTCSCCETTLPIKLFGRSEKWTHNFCKICANKKNKKWLKDNPCRATLYRIKNRCSTKKSRYYKKGVKCLISLKEIEILWKRDNGSKLKRYSIDRKDSSGDYTFDNCRFIELSENSSLAFRPSTRTYSKRIIQLTIAGVTIRKWKSASEASLITHITHTGIVNCLKQRTKTSGGFVWKYQS